MKTFQVLKTMGLACVLFLWVPGIAFGNDPVQISSSYVYWPPTIDGVVGWGAWNMPNRIDYDWGFITVHHDDVRLYILVDVLDDTTDDPLSFSPVFWRLTGDYFWLTLDADRDGLITPGDLKYELSPGTHNMFYRYHVAPARGGVSRVHLVQCSGGLWLFPRRWNPYPSHVPPCPSLQQASSLGVGDRSS